MAMNAGNFVHKWTGNLKQKGFFNKKDAGNITDWSCDQVISNIQNKTDTCKETERDNWNLCNEELLVWVFDKYITEIRNEEGNIAIYVTKSFKWQIKIWMDSKRNMQYLKYLVL